MDEDLPEERPKQGYFYGKRKRGRLLSCHQSLKVNQKSSSCPSSRSSGDVVQPQTTPAPQERGRNAPEPNEVTNWLQLQGQKRKISRNELLSALKKAHKEMANQQFLLAASEKKCSQLTTKKSLLVECIRDTRSQARYSKAATARAEEEAELLPLILTGVLKSFRWRSGICS
jgi:hypothetical protein